MKYLKTFENINNKTLQVGDYVQIGGEHFNETLIQFFKKEIGQLMNIDEYKEFPYLVNFKEKIPVDRTDEEDTLAEDENEHNMRFDKDEIIYFSSSKEELELKIAADKYNL